MYHRRALSYWFHIICNSLYLPSRLFSSPPCFMWLCPFLIRVTDRRSAEKDGKNERESGDFVTGVFVCLWILAVGWVWVWTSPDIFPVDWNPYPPPILSTLYLMWVKGRVIPSKNMDWILRQTITNDVQVNVQRPKKVKNPTDFIQLMLVVQLHAFQSALIHTLVPSGLCLSNTDGLGQCNYRGQWVW